MIERIKGKNILVVGMGRSGLAAAGLLAGKGAASITVADQKKTFELTDALAALKRYPSVEVKTGGTPPGLVQSGLSLVVKSPGVPSRLDIFKRARGMGVPVISEVELAYHFIKAPLLGITGTNGKTTTTALVAAMLREARFDPVFAAGNIGNPLCGIAAEAGAQGLVVAELSSFQLDDIESLRPLVAAFLNFEEDHLDYHLDLEAYFEAKARIFENQVESDYAVLNANNEAVSALQKRCKGQVLWFGRGAVEAGFGLSGGNVALFRPNEAPQEICAREEVSLPGDHNLENALAAATVAWAAGADPDSITTVLQTFKGIEHRLEHVATLNGVDYVNDSKGTNPGATMKALLSFPGRSIILIAGGKDRKSDFTQLAEMCKKKVRQIVLLGETAAVLARALEGTGFKAYSLVENLEEAVECARKAARFGELVLLSPACASWDMFSSYEQRGALFKEKVFSLE